MSRSVPVILAFFAVLVGLWQVWLGYHPVQVEEAKANISIVKHEPPPPAKGPGQALSSTETPNVQPIAVAPTLFADLTIKTTPDDAIVTVDDKPVENHISHIDLADQATKDVVVKVTTVDGDYVGQMRTVTVTRGMNVEIPIELSKVINKPEQASSSILRPAEEGKSPPSPMPSAPERWTIRGVANSRSPWEIDGSLNITGDKVHVPARFCIKDRASATGMRVYLPHGGFSKVKADDHEVVIEGEGAWEYFCRGWNQGYKTVVGRAKITFLPDRTSGDRVKVEFEPRANSRNADLAVETVDAHFEGPGFAIK